MAKKDGSKATPRLRFPEFRGTEEWEEKTLDTLCTVNPPNDILPETFIYIDLESVEAGTLNSRNRVDRVNAPSRAQRLLKNGDTIYQIVRPYQRNNLFIEFNDDELYVASTGYAQLRPKSSERFVYHVVHTDPFVNKVIAKCTGSNYPAINSSDLAEVSLYAPPTQREQQKIADCLTSLDELIATQARKVEALKEHKRGLMQELFPREGETVPRLRFPEFRDEPEWRETTLEKVVDFKNGKAHENNVAENGPYILVNSKFISTDGKVRKYADQGFCLAKTDDVLMVMSDVPNGRAIAKCFLVDKDDTYTVNQRICKLTPQKVEPGFLVKILDRNPFYLSFDDGVKQTNLRKDDVLNCPLLLPENLGEQRRIASCLSSLDALIAAESKKLDLLKTHKKGLMQQLFPIGEEES